MLDAGKAEALLGRALEHEYNLADLLRRPGIDFDTVARVSSEAGLDPTVSRETLAGELGHPLADTVIEQIEISTKYAGYIDKQSAEVERAAHYEAMELPADFDYASVKALSFEVRQKLSSAKPSTLGAAARISGITPAAISLLLVHLKKHRPATPIAARRAA